MKVADQRDLLETWYKAIRSQDIDEANNWKKRFDSKDDLFTEPKEKKFYRLLTLRYDLMFKNYKSAEASLATLQVQEDEGSLLNYYYYFFKGIYSYDRQDYRLAIENYLQAKEFMKTVDHEEMAEFYYKLSSAYQRNYEITQSIKYAEKALDLFRLRNDHKRMVACEIVLGINNQDIKQYKEAELHYHSALVSSDKAGDRVLKLLVLHNYGVLASKQNHSETALSFLLKAKELIEPWENRIKVQNLYLIARNHFKTGQNDSAWLKLKFALMVSEQNGFEDYSHRCKMLKVKYREPERFEETYKKGILFFIEHEVWDLIIEYSEELAAYFRKKGLHENCGEYYTLAATARNKMNKERGIPNG